MLLTMDFLFITGGQDRSLVVRKTTPHLFRVTDFLRNHQATRQINPKKHRHVLMQTDCKSDCKFA